MKVMKLNGLLRKNAQFIESSFPPNLITIKEIENYLNNHKFNLNELQVICPDTNSKLDYKYHTQPWRNSYDPDVIEYLWNDGFSFILHTALINKKVKKIVSEIEKLNFVSCDAHVYCGKSNSQSFVPHSDDSYNLIVQCAGESLWTVWPHITSEGGSFPNLDDDPLFEVVMKPGDSIVVPRGQIHRAQPLTDRISVSFPFLPGPKTIHRNIKLSWE